MSKNFNHLTKTDFFFISSILIQDTDWQDKVFSLTSLDLHQNHPGSFNKLFHNLMIPSYNYIFQNVFYITIE